MVKKQILLFNRKTNIILFSIVKGTKNNPVKCYYKAKPDRRTAKAYNSTRISKKEYWNLFNRKRDKNEWRTLKNE